MSALELERVRDRLAALGRPHTHADVAEAIRDEGQLASDAAVRDAVEALRLSSEGAGPLEEYLRLPGVTDVLVNGPHDVFVDRGGGLERVDVDFGSDLAVRRLAQRLAASVGRRLDDAVPFVDARLADGTRVHAALASVAAPGTCLSLRVPARRSFSLAECVASGALPASGAEVLTRMVDARLAFLISGGTGSGKTTLLGALLALVPPDQRIVIVEDSRELDPVHPHVVRMEGRPDNTEQRGGVTLTDLVRQSLRMRPDRLVVGEVRGAELSDLLMAMNTGHEGGCGTVHANSASDVPARLEALGALGGLSRPALHAQLGAALDVVVHVRRTTGGRREVSELHVLQRDPRSGLVSTVPALSFGRVRTALGPGAPLLDRLLDR